MNSGKLQKWALTAEIIGGLAIVLSLIMVAVELNQSTRQQELNTNALEISAYQELANSFSNLAAIRIQDVELNKLLIKATTDPESLSEDERTRTSLYIAMILRHGDMAYFQYQRGAIDQERLDSMLTPVTLTLKEGEYFRRRWEISKSYYTKPYVEYIDNKVGNQ